MITEDKISVLARSARYRKVSFKLSVWINVPRNGWRNSHLTFLSKSISPCGVHTTLQHSVPNWQRTLLIFVAWGSLKGEPVLGSSSSTNPFDLQDTCPRCPQSKVYIAFVCFWLRSLTLFWSAWCLKCFPHDSREYYLWLRLSFFSQIRKECPSGLKNVTPWVLCEGTLAKQNKLSYGNKWLDRL